MQWTIAGRVAVVNRDVQMSTPSPVEVVVVVGQVMRKERGCVKERMSRN